MLYIIGILLIFIVIISYILYTKIQTIKKINQYIIDGEKRPTVLGKVEALSKSDYIVLKSDVNILDKIIKLYVYKIAKFNDILRKSNKEELERNIGWLNCLYEQHLIFYKMREKVLRANKEEETK